jgi:PPP family 3-phenylpropionic acid transporter
VPAGVAVSISTFWFLFLGANGVSFPFLSLYLRENLGLSGTEVGLVGMVPPLVGIAAQPLFGQVADRSGRRTHVLALLCFGTAVFGACLSLPATFAGVLLAIFAMAVFASPLGPTAMSVSLGALAETGAHRFGRLRLFGSLGFVLAAVSTPLAIDALQAWRGLAARVDLPSEPGLGAIFLGFGALSAAAGIAALRIPAGGALGARASSRDWRALRSNRPFLTQLAFSFSAFACLEGPMFLFPVFVREHGGDLGTVSRMWLLMTLLEVPLLLASSAALRRFGPRALFFVGLSAAGLRWVLCGFSDDLRVLYAAQLLHGVAVAGFLGPAFYVDSVVPERLRSTGQAGVALATSLGVVLSVASGGWLVEHVGIAAPYRLGGIGAIALAALIPFALPSTPRYAEISGTSTE